MILLTTGNKLGQLQHLGDDMDKDDPETKSVIFVCLVFKHILMLGNFSENNNKSTRHKKNVVKKVKLVR